MKIFNLYMRSLLRRRPGAVESVIGSLRSDDRYSNKNVKKTSIATRTKQKENKQTGLISKTTLLHVHQTFWYISLWSRHDYNLISSFMKDLNKIFFLFLNLDMAFRNLL